VLYLSCILQEKQRPRQAKKSQESVTNGFLSDMPFR